MGMTSTKIITSILAVVLLASFVVFGYKKFYAKQNGTAVNDESAESASTTSETSGIVGIKGSGDFTVNPLPVPGAKISVPDLNRPMTVTVELPADAKKLVLEKIAELESNLKKDGSNVDNWLTLAIYRKTIGDYIAARDIWDYLGNTDPKNFVSFANLGDLYANYLKDAAKAEENFKKAIANDSSYTYVYRNFADFYRYVKKDDAKAKAILKQGIAANPTSSQDLEYVLNNYDTFK